MKKCSSLVWQFFDRIEENGRCVAIQCKLCDNEYKYFGNTTNLRVHLSNKHPIQWDLAREGSLSGSFRTDDEANQTPVTKKRKYGARGKDKNVRYSIIVDPMNVNDNTPGISPMRTIEIQRVDVLDNSEAEEHVNEEEEAAINIVRQMHKGSDEEWLEEDAYQTLHTETYEPKRAGRMKYKKIKREVITPPPQRVSYYSPMKPEKPERVIIEEKKDEYSVFGEYVANKLRKFKAPRTRGNLQQLITTILWQAEYGMYDDASAVKRVLLYAVQDPEPEHHVIEQVTVHEAGNINSDEQVVSEEPINRSIETDIMN